MTDQSVSLNLRSGPTYWEMRTPPAALPPGHPLISCDADVAIIGAGITGSLIAERLSRAGLQIVVIDRHGPQQGSTAASTAIVQWEIDNPMAELEARIGFDLAARVFRYAYAGVQDLARIIDHLGIACDAAWRSSLFLSGDQLDARQLREEYALRHRAGLPLDFLQRDDLVARFGIDRPAALLSRDACDVNPVALARGLLTAAMARGVQVMSPLKALDYDFSREGVTVQTDRGVTVKARHLVLATGFEMPVFVPATRHDIVSTWALATAPQPRGVPWPGAGPIWEASDPYLYVRGTADGSILCGGEDEAITDAKKRDALLPAKTARLMEKLRQLLPGVELDIATAWSGFFGISDDGLPLIGRVPACANCYAAYGYGGNGITFSVLAADMVASYIAGQRHWAEELFAVDR